MTFRYEHQMLPPAEKWLSSEGLATKREFRTTWGICDVVGCSLKEENIKQRIEFGQLNPIGPQLRVMILSEIPDQEEGKSITLRRLHHKFAHFLDENRIALELNRLVSDRFVHTTSRGAFQKRNGWAPLHKRIVALELKLTRINEALHQAISNLEFAGESYVGVPMQIAQRLVTTRKHSEFSDKGIGLLGVGMEKCEVFLEPDPAKSHQNQIVQMYCVEHFWRTYFRGS